MQNLVEYIREFSNGDILRTQKLNDKIHGEFTIEYSGGYGKRIGYADNGDVLRYKTYDKEGNLCHDESTIVPLKGSGKSLVY